MFRKGTKARRCLDKQQLVIGGGQGGSSLPAASSVHQEREWGGGELLSCMNISTKLEKRGWDLKGTKTSENQWVVNPSDPFLRETTGCQQGAVFGKKTGELDSVMLDQNLTPMVELSISG